MRGIQRTLLCKYVVVIENVCKCLRTEIHSVYFGFLLFRCNSSLKNLDLSAELISLIGHREEIQKPIFFKRIISLFPERRAYAPNSRETAERDSLLS